MQRVVLALLLVAVVTAIPTPVVFDTDIGTDFDDSAAIALALSDPSLDVKLIVVRLFFPAVACGSRRPAAFSAGVAPMGSAL